MLLEVDAAELLSCGTVLDDAGAVELLPVWLLELELFISLLLLDGEVAAGAAEFWSGVVVVLWLEAAGAGLEGAVLLWFELDEEFAWFMSVLLLDAGAVLVVDDWLLAGAVADGV